MPLTEAFPDGGYDTNKSRATALAQAGIEYYRAWHLVVAGREVTGLCLHVELSLMPMVPGFGPLINCSSNRSCNSLA
jgi:hypothetical protein